MITRTTAQKNRLSSRSVIFPELARTGAKRRPTNHNLQYPDAWSRDLS